ncbi:MAG: sodium pump decarboxylase subunit gamma [Spirochaetia bacterium]|nr:sodium pump decarboxylase subunit gamma [Spirochaetia bacterium]
MVFLTQLPKEQLIAQLNNGVILMFLGIGTVFVFLTLLVFLTKGLSATVRKFFPQKSPAVVQRPASTEAVAVGTAPDAEIAAAIVAAFVKSKE